MTGRDGLRCPPPTPDALVGFPSAEKTKGSTLWRAAKRGYNPWFFQSGEDGRFNLDDPNGTCYTAEEMWGAALETIEYIEDGSAVAAEFFQERRLYPLKLPFALQLADTTSRQALAFGIAHEISTTDDWNCTRAWAAALHASGAQGIVALLHRDNSGNKGYSLFGKAGERNWKYPDHIPISETLIEAFMTEFGLRVARRPRFDELELI